MKKRFILAILFIVFQIVDFCLTTWAVSHGIAEMNPLAAPLVLTWQYPLIKLGVSSLVALLLVTGGKGSPRFCLSALTVLCAAAGVVAAVQIYGVCFYLSC